MTGNGRRLRLTLSVLAVAAGVAVEIYALFGAYVSRGMAKTHFPEQPPPPLLSRDLLIATGAAALLFVCAALLALGVNRSTAPTKLESPRNDE